MQGSSQRCRVITIGLGSAVIVGCSHLGVKNILKAADFDVLKDLKLLYPEKYVEGGVGKEIEI